MSWIEKVKSKMTIITGDNVSYQPAWLHASISTKFRYKVFNFMDVKGSYVDRREREGNSYNLEIYFQGDDHLDIAQKFRESCDKSRNPWVIQHPLYDQLIVQPLSLEYGNQDGNVTKVTGTVMETLQNPPLTNLFSATPEELMETMDGVAETAANSVTEIPDPADINSMTEANNNNFKRGVKIISDPIDYEKYNNAFTTASTYINSATATPLLAMRNLIAAIQLPGQFAAQANLRLKVLFDTFDTLRNNILGLVTKSSKQIYCAQQCASISALCASAATPTSPFKTSSGVYQVIQQISARYANLQQDLDQIQSPNANEPSSYVADAELLHQLDQMVKQTLASLFTIALNAPQERIVYMEKDTNIITLTHRLYGLDSSDKKMDDLINNNAIKADEYLQILKDRKIVYYI
jgi:hypothetical protein